MVSLFDLIKTNAWLSLKLTLQKLYPDQEEYLDDYEKMFQQLKEMQPKASNVTIEVEWVHDSYDNTDYVNISGYYTDPADRIDPYTNSLAIEFTPWDEWLGMPIDKKTLKTFNELEILAYCLDEMSFAGFDQEEIQSQFDHIKSIKEEYDSLSPEEKKSKTFTLDELKNMIEDNDPEEQDDNNDNENGTKK